MPEQAFARSIQLSSSGFDSKLQGLMSIGNAIAQGQMMKHQMSQQMQAQKELIDYRADTEFEKQQKIQTEILGPAQQAQLQADQQKAFVKSINDAKETAQTWAKNHSQNYSKLNDYNLFSVAFDHSRTADPNTGLVTPSVYVKGEDENYVPVGYSDYLQEADRRLAFANYLDKTEQDLRENKIPNILPEGEQFVDGREVMTADKAEDMVSSIRSDPSGQTAETMYRAWREGNFAITRQPQSQGSTSGPPSTSVTMLSTLRTMAGEDGVINFSNYKDAGWFSWGDPEKVTATVNFNGQQSVPEIVEQLNLGARQLFDIDLSSIPAGERQAVLAGMPREVEDKEAKKIADKIKDLREDEVRGEEFDKIASLYYNIPAAYSEWKEKNYNFPVATLGDNKVTINLQGATNVSNIFKPIENNSAVFQQTVFDLGTQN